MTVFVDKSKFAFSKPTRCLIDAAVLFVFHQSNLVIDAHAIGDQIGQVLAVALEPIVALQFAGRVIFEHQKRLLQNRVHNVGANEEKSIGKADEII